MSALRSQWGPRGAAFLSVLGPADDAAALKMGRPKLPKAEAKSKIVPVRFEPDDLKHCWRVG